MYQSALEPQARVLSFRNDRMGARLLNLMNAIRISRDYGVPYSFAWKTDGRTSEELKSPTDIFDKEYFEARHLPLQDFRETASEVVNLEFLPAAATEDDLRSWIATGKSLLCEASILLACPGRIGRWWPRAMPRRSRI